MTNKHEEGFMPNGKPSSQEWIRELFEYDRAYPDKDAKKILFQAMNTDSLTQVLARSGIDHLVEEIETTQTPTGVLFFDLMGFKEVNDFQGHDAGDQVLTDTAETLSNIFRTGHKGDRRKSRRTVYELSKDRRTYSLEEDIVFRKLTEDSELGRIGGDEFLVLLPRVKTYQALENIGFRVAGAMNQDLKCQPSSIGAALYSPKENSMVETIKNADQAMFAAKRALKKDESRRGLDRSESGFATYHPDSNFSIYLPEQIRAKLSE
ncbi:GGDEF domain-containing protein [Candidatus Woesearchaeota archaeon]|jgi:GGDEF domain-containing protein|nr:GGDEF domain-containing protein [Candidatus Woesearchaeota archaeon]MBT6045011.1 GGDEF domain-containing protein [Candidatus Woesearchaeota archaeon]